MNTGKLEPISLSNRNARKHVETIELLSDLVFENHPIYCTRDDKFKDCIAYKFASVLMKLRQRKNFTDVVDLHVIIKLCMCCVARF